MAEWLGRGLQNLVQRFESASDLQRFRQTTDFYQSFFLFVQVASELSSVYNLRQEVSREFGLAPSLRIRFEMDLHTDLHTKRGVTAVCHNSSF